MGIFGKKSPDALPSGLVDLTKKAAVSLTKSGLSDHKAAVYLVLDHSGSMQHYYRDGSVQRLAEQALGLSANLDDDGTVPLVYFGSSASRPQDVALTEYSGVIERTHKHQPWGYTDYVSGMNEVVSHYQASGATDPALVIFQTDGSPDSRPAAEGALRSYSGLPIFWAFVGFGPKSAMEFLTTLDDLPGRRVDNASFFHAANPKATTDEALYDGITHEYAGWLAAARTAGVIA